ncbi:proton-coupled folate transporter-like [Amphiura filiformis]|uniref:proton-coupled folate transporter-like n=1 Tax=Amphiura filiformis TaxID=82378 RepID=UPI003B2256E1
MAEEDINVEVKSKPSRKNMAFLQPAPPGSPPNLQRAFSRYITIEPVIFLPAVGFGVVTSVLPQFLQHTIAIEQNVTLPDDNGGINGTCVDQNTSDPHYMRLQEVQAEVSYWQMVISMCGIIPSIIVAPLLSTWSDRGGRKIILGFVLLGYLVFMVGFILVHRFALPLWVLAVAKFFEGLTGSDTLLAAQYVAYISDITNKETRLLRFAIVFTMPSIGIGSTQVAIGYLIEDYGFGPALWISFIAYCLAFLYIIIPPFLIETVDRNEKNAKPGMDQSESGVIYGLKSLILLFKNKTRLRRWRLGFLYMIVFMNQVINTAVLEIVLVYGLGTPFCWPSVLVAGYTTLSIVSSALGALIGSKGFSLCLSDLWNLQVSMVFGILFGYLHAIANTTLGLYIAVLLASLRSISMPLIPAMLAKVVSEHEHGVVFGFKASIESIGNLLSPLLINSIYSKTVQTQQNMVFIIHGTLGFIPLILTAVLQVITRHDKEATGEKASYGTF